MAQRSKRKTQDSAEGSSHAVRFSDPWEGDAYALNISESDLRKFNPVSNSEVQSFLDDDGNTNARILAAPKGYGKTILLRKKAVEMRRKNRRAIIHPSDGQAQVERLNAVEAIDALYSSSELLGDAQHSSPLAEFWVWAIGARVVELVRRDELRGLEQAVALDEEKHRHFDDDTYPLISLEHYKKFRTLFGYRTTVGGYLEAVLNNYRKDKEDFGLIYRFVIAPTMERLDKDVFIFLDAIDEAFTLDYPKGQVVASVSDEPNRIENNAGLSHRADVDLIEAGYPPLWAWFQASLVLAVRKLSVHRRLKVYATMRSEAIAAVRHQHLQQAESFIRHFEYTGRELLTIFEQRVEMMDSALLPSPQAEKAIVRFCGEEKLVLANGQTEPVSQYILRHTLLRPRDVIEIGKVLAKLNCPHVRTNVDDFRTAVNTAAEYLFSNFRYQCVPAFPNEAIQLIDLCLTNILSHGDLIALAKKVHPDCPDLGETAWNFLYSAGLLGIVGPITGKDGIYQRFLKATGSMPARTRDFPAAKYYVLHPIVYGSRPTHFAPNRKIIVGYDLPFPEITTWQIEIDSTIRVKYDGKEVGKSFFDSTPLAVWLILTVCVDQYKRVEFTARETADVVHKLSNRFVSKGSKLNSTQLSKLNAAQNAISKLINDSDTSTTKEIRSSLALACGFPEPNVGFVGVINSGRSDGKIFIKQYDVSDFSVSWS